MAIAAFSLRFQREGLSILQTSPRSCVFRTPIAWRHVRLFLAGASKALLDRNQSVRYVRVGLAITWPPYNYVVPDTPFELHVCGPRTYKPVEIYHVAIKWDSCYTGFLRDRVYVSLLLVRHVQSDARYLQHRDTSASKSTHTPHAH